MKEVYQKDEYDDEEFTWQEKPLKNGYERPVIIHRAVLGSVERLMAILIENTAGYWPFWISPRQAKICTVKDSVQDYADKIYKTLVYLGYNVEKDFSSSKIQKKIRNSEIEHFNYTIVIGESEVKNNTVNLRDRDNNVIGEITISQLLDRFNQFNLLPSRKEIKIREESVFQYDKNSNDLNKRLERELFLGGDEPNQEDYESYKYFESIDVCKLSYPNVRKWKKLMSNAIKL